MVLLYTALTKLSIGLPLRTLVLVFLSGMIFLAYREESRNILRKNKAITAAFVALGTIGFLLDSTTASAVWAPP